MRNTWIGTVLVAVSLVAAGCDNGPGAGATDAGSSGDTPSGDGGTVIGDGACRTTRQINGRQPIYGACRSNLDCVEGLSCSTEADQGMPGGQCNHACTRDDDCVLFPPGGAPVDGYCAPADRMGRRICMRICVNGLDCERDGYSCTILNARTLNEVKVCVPVCTDATCSDCTTCNRDIALCRSTTAAPLPGRAIGESCLASNNPMVTPATRCRSERCLAESASDSMGRPTYSGWNGGTCFSQCILPSMYNSSTFWPEPMLPRGNCPERSICVPNGSLAEGDLGICLLECRQDSECRRNQGYFCRKSFQLSATRTARFENGYCVPINCRAAGMTCPTGFTCRMNSATSGTCIPATMM